ncbi:hypothetical protein HJC10_25215 [Corallococcus exiguus]|nr:hypothetical protein [Corallococcus exiguus]
MVPLAALHLAARALKPEAWGGRSADVLDRVYRQRLLRILSQRDAEQELAELQDHLERVAGRVRRHTQNSETAKLGEGWAARWHAFADLVDARRAAIASQDPKRVLERTHVSEILKLVRAGEVRDPNGVPQALLRSELGLKKANLTRILNVMEANELIERRGTGRENLIRLGRAVRELAMTTDARTLAQPYKEVRRGLDYFSKTTSFMATGP